MWLCERKKEILSDVKTVIGKKLKLDFAKKMDFAKKKKFRNQKIENKTRGQFHQHFTCADPNRAKKTVK